LVAPQSVAHDEVVVAQDVVDAVQRLAGIEKTEFWAPIWNPPSPFVASFIT
jgi:hypothetical protein